MAERRMFAKTIIDSDAFLDMPLSTQALYFHLAMRADDDGFLNNHKRIMRTIGCSEDDFKVLVAKNFLIIFETGVIVIKHWKMHNYIQKDRYKPTVYQEEKQLLTVKNNKSYTLDTECIQDGYTLDTQVRLGKVRLEIGKGSGSSTCKHEVQEKELPPPQPNIFKYFEQNIGMIAPIVAEKIIHWQEEFTDDIIEKAIDKAVMAGARNWNYINAILNAWKSEGVKVLADIKDGRNVNAGNTRNDLQTSNGNEAYSDVDWNSY